MRAELDNLSSLTLQCLTGIVEPALKILKIELLYFPIYRGKK